MSIFTVEIHTFLTVEADNEDEACDKASQRLADLNWEAWGLSPDVEYDAWKE